MQQNSQINELRVTEQNYKWKIKPTAVTCEIYLKENI